MQKLVQGIKTKRYVLSGQQFPTSFLIALLCCLILCRLDYAAIFLNQMNANSLMSLKKQLNCALKRTFSDEKLNLLPQYGKVIIFWN